MMDSDKTNTDTQHDVDLIILDYLLCIGIDVLIHGRKTGRGHTESWDNWVLNSIHSKFRSWGVFLGNGPVRLRASMLSATAFRYILPPSHTLPQDLLIKLQLLDFADIFSHDYTQLVPHRTSAAECSSYEGYIQTQFEAHTTNHGRSKIFPATSPGPSNPRTNTYLYRIIPEFMKLCVAAKEKVSITRWVDILTQFMTQAVAEEYYSSGRQLPELFNKYPFWKPEDQTQALVWEQATASHMQTQKGISPGTNFEATLNERSLSRLEDDVTGFLSDLMETLDAPVLVQLERGQIGQLSHAETEQLKSRVGFR